MYTLHFSPRTVVLVLLMIATTLLVSDLVTQYIKYFHGDDWQFGFVRLLDLEREGNLPSWYSSVTLLLCSALLGIIGLHHKEKANPYARHWLALAILFFLSLRG